MAKKKESSKPTQFLNKKAGHEFFILEKYEAGIQLQGSEIKAIREARVNLKESFVRIIKDEVFLLNAHITHLSTAHATYRPEEKRDRKLLLHRNEIEKLSKKVERDGLTIVVTKMYFNSRNLVKVQIALAQGKKLHDKRNDLKQKTMQRETQQALKNFR
ncbi:MAG: SsrA-binding protein SmpB [Campylobacteraceae bacterium]|nr:SsrA-binding protein SmpB [Campylobacteraceae bacterium]